MLGLALPVWDKGAKQARLESRRGHRVAKVEPKLCS